MKFPREVWPCVRSYWDIFNPFVPVFVSHCFFVMRYGVLLLCIPGIYVIVMFLLPTVHLFLQCLHILHMCLILDNAGDSVYHGDPCSISCFRWHRYTSPSYSVLSMLIHALPGEYCVNNNKCILKSITAGCRIIVWQIMKMCAIFIGHICLCINVCGHLIIPAICGPSVATKAKHRIV